MKRLALMALALSACAQKPPPPPPELAAALAATSASLEQGKMIVANTVSTQLQNFAGREKVRPRMKDWLMKLAVESEALKGLPPELAKPYWKALEPRIRLALEDKDPGPGPRFRPDLPLNVSNAIGELDNALRDHNLQAACNAADQVTMELSDWSWSTPAPRAWQRVRSAVEKLDALPDTCRDSKVSTVKQTVEKALDELRP